MSPLVAAFAACFLFVVAAAQYVDEEAQPELENGKLPIPLLNRMMLEAVISEMQQQQQADTAADNSNNSNNSNNNKPTLMEKRYSEAEMSALQTRVYDMMAIRELLSMLSTQRTSQRSYNKRAPAVAAAAAAGLNSLDGGVGLPASAWESVKSAAAAAAANGLDNVDGSLPDSNQQLVYRALLKSMISQ